MRDSFFYLFLVLFISCGDHSKEMKEPIMVESESDFIKDTLRSVNKYANFSTAKIEPKDVIQTGISDVRLISIHKKNSVNSTIYYKDDKHANDVRIDINFIPGVAFMYGYNMVNLAHCSLKETKKSHLFQKLGWIKSLYYPSLEKDSIDKKPIFRDFILASVYNEDTSKDKLINKNDLRRLYYFDIQNTLQQLLTPKDCSVYKSEYDDRNNAMLLFARNYINQNGTMDKDEPISIFTIDIKIQEKLN